MSIYVINISDKYVEIHRVTPDHVEYYTFDEPRRIAKTGWSVAILHSNISKNDLEILCKAYTENDKETLAYYSLVYSK